MILTSNNATSVLFVFMGMKTLAVTLREESISRVFENRVQSRVFESKMNEMTGGWRRLHSKKVHNLESLLNRKMGGEGGVTKRAWEEEKSVHSFGWTA